MTNTPQFWSQVCLQHKSLLHRQPFCEGTTCCKLSGSHSDNRIFRCRTSRQLSLEAILSFRVRLDKCKFMAPSITYLSHQIDSEGLHPIEDKIWAIRDALAPFNITELKAFLGLFQFYSRYIPNIADKLGPYTACCGRVSLGRGKHHSLAFQQVKESLQANLVLVHYDPKKELILTCDASQYSVRAVLSNGSEKPVSYASRTLSAAEKNYCQLDKEGLGIIFWSKKITLVPTWTDFPDCYGSQATCQSFQPDKAYPQ